jgi:hypothetical protein
MSAAVLSFHLSENMECAELSIKEETEDETKYGSYGLHPDTGVLGEASTKVNVRQTRSISFRFLLCTFFIAGFSISQSSCRSVRYPASCL